MAPNFVTDGGSTSLIKVIVFDIDGTLANIEHRRHYVATKPKNWAAFNAGMEHDTPHEDIVKLAHTLHDYHPIVFCSGRGEESREKTMRWLADWCNFRHVQDEDSALSYYYQLYMRPKGDYRPDDIIKEELLDQMLSDGYEPHMVFDDRDRVVAMWRRRGYRCLQVAPGNF